MTHGRSVILPLIRGVVFVGCLIAASGVLTAQSVDVSGRWFFFLTTGEYSAEYPAELQTEGERVTGTLAGQKVDGTFKDGDLALKFPFHPPEAGAADVLTITARLDGDTLSGGFTFGEYAGTCEGTRRR
jgi:hypothetical protein